MMIGLDRCAYTRIWERSEEYYIVFVDRRHDCTIYGRLSEDLMAPNLGMTKAPPGIRMIVVSCDPAAHTAIWYEYIIYRVIAGRRSIMVDGGWWPTHFRQTHTRKIIVSKIYYIMI